MQWTKGVSEVYFCGGMEPEGGGHGACTRSCRALALAIAWVRRCTPSLLQMLETCFFTVPRLRIKRQAMS